MKYLSIAFPKTLQELFLGSLGINVDCNQIDNIGLQHLAKAYLGNLRRLSFSSHFFRQITTEFEHRTGTCSAKQNSKTSECCYFVLFI
jgi:hypothetical protein